MRSFIRKTEIESVDDGFLLRFVGPLDAAAGIAMGEGLAKLARVGDGRVTLDFGQVPYVDDTGVRLCEELRRELARTRGVGLGSCPHSLAVLIADLWGQPSLTSHFDPVATGMPSARDRNARRGARRFEVPWIATVTAPTSANLRWHRFFVRDAGMGGLRLEAALPTGENLVRGTCALVRLQRTAHDLQPVVFTVRVVHHSAPQVMGVEIIEKDPETIRRYLALLAEACPED